MVERVLDATREAVEGRPDWNWDGEDRSLRGMCASWQKKHPPKPEKKRKPAPKLPDIDKPIVFANPAGPASAEVDRRDDPEPAGAQMHSLAVARAERDLKKDKGSKNTHVVLTRGLLDALKERGEQIIYEGGRMHRYRNGLWEALSAEQEKTWLSTEIQAGCEALELTSRNALVGEVRGFIARLPELHREEIPWDQHGMIATRPGMVDPETGALRPATPEDYATHRVECDYDPRAKCKLWLQFLKDCLPNQKTTDIVQEVFGASLIENKSRDMTRALVLFAPPSTGKSSLLSVFAGLLSDNPNTTPFDQIEKTVHGTTNFLRPAPWMLHEAFDQSKWHFSATVKALLSGEDIHVNVKSRPAPGDPQVQAGDHVGH